MRLLPTIVLLSIAVHSTVGRCKRPRVSPLMGTLQSILSPANAERTMQMLNIATQQTIGNAVGTCNPQPIKYSPPILPYPEPCNLQIPCNALLPYKQPIQLPIPNPPCPIQVQVQTPLSYQQVVPSCFPLPTPPIQLPTPQIQLPTPQIQLPTPQIQLPTPQIQLPIPPIQLPIQVPTPPNPIPMQIPSQTLPLPCQLPMPTPVPMPEIVIERPSCIYDREIVYPAAEMPIYEYNPPLPEVIGPVALTSAQDIYTCPLPSPAALFNLPAASPRCSCGLDGVGTRSQFLRKIPIPPPTL